MENIYQLLKLGEKQAHFTTHSQKLTDCNGKSKNKVDKQSKCTTDMCVTDINHDATIISLV